MNEEKLLHLKYALAVLKSERVKLDAAIAALNVVMPTIANE